MPQTDYELARAARIAQNRALLATLNLPSTSEPATKRRRTTGTTTSRRTSKSERSSRSTSRSRSRSSSPDPLALTPRKSRSSRRANGTQVKKTRTSLPSAPLRSSARIANKPAPTADTSVDLELLDKQISSPLPRARKVRLAPEPGPDLAPELAERWLSSDESAPVRDEEGCYVFPDFPDFRPNLSPAEMVHLGVFGGTMYAAHYSSVLRRQLDGGVEEVREDMPDTWLEGLDIEGTLCGETYDEGVNRWRVKAGQSLSEWEKNGWVWGGDPRGWGQWYVRFWRGRRVEGEDERQVGRWARCVGVGGRWRRRGEKEVRMGSGNGGQMERGEAIVRQICLQWGWDVDQGLAVGGEEEV